MVFIVGFQTMAVAPKDSPSQNKTLPLGRSAELTVTIGKRNYVPDQTPEIVGLPGGIEGDRNGARKAECYSRSPWRTQ